MFVNVRFRFTPVHRLSGLAEPTMQEVAGPQLANVGTCIIIAQQKEQVILHSELNHIKSRFSLQEASGANAQFLVLLLRWMGSSANQLLASVLRAPLKKLSEIGMSAESSVKRFDGRKQCGLCCSCSDDLGISSRALGMQLPSLCTIITTTSPTPSNPSTELICSTLESLAEFVPELLQCRHIIVCDGYRMASDSKFRSGVVTEERANAYEQYVGSLEIFSKTRPSPVWAKVEVLRLAERQGFGFAVRAALELVCTPFVCIMQHDRTFMRGFEHVQPLLQAMLQNPCLKMVGLPTTTNDPTRYIIQAVTKLGEMKVSHPPFESLMVKSSECPSLRFIPMIMWHDSTHFASTSYYREFVFGRRHLVTRGGFIEDKLGQQQGMDLRSLGWSSHATYGTPLSGSKFSQLSIRG